MPADGCCSAAEANGLITLGLLAAGGFVYWRQSNWIVGTATATSGHTIKVGKKGVRVRLHALYALQVGYGKRPPQPWYDAAGVEHDGGQFCKDALASQVNGKKVKCRIRQQNAGWGRVGATVYVDCEDVGYWMVRNGYALADPIKKDRHWPTLRTYRKAEKRAKKEKLGIHQGRFEHPRDWIRDYIRGEFKERGFDPEGLGREAFERGVNELIRSVAEEAVQEFLTELACEWIIVAAL